MQCNTVMHCQKATDFMPRVPIEPVETSGTPWSGPAAVLARPVATWEGQRAVETPPRPRAKSASSVGPVGPPGFPAGEGAFQGPGGVGIRRDSSACRLAFLATMTGQPYPHPCFDRFRVVFPNFSGEGSGKT